MDHAAIREFCLQLPGATRDIKWRIEEVFSVGGKMFCLMCSDPAQSSGVMFKADPARFLELTDQPGIRSAPYLGRYHWIHLERPDVVAPTILTSLLEDAYRLVRIKLPKRLRDTLPPFVG